MYLNIDFAEFTNFVHINIYYLKAYDDEKEEKLLIDYYAHITGE